MGLLGQFLESFYSNDQDFQSVQAHVRHECTDIGRSETSRRRMIGRTKPTANKPVTTLADLRFWALLPNQVRVDTTTAKDGNAETRVEITRGSERLKRSPDGSVEVGSERAKSRRDSDLLPTDFRRHFDRSLIRQFFASLVLEELGDCRIAGRDCVRIRAIPISGDAIWPHWLSPDADEYEFAADLEFPSLLAIRSLQSGTTIETLETITVTFNGLIEGSVFTCEPIAGKAVRPAEPIAMQISLEAARSKVPFAILLPTKGIGDSTPDIHYHPPRHDSHSGYLTVFFRSTSDNSFWLHLSAQQDPDHERELEWEPLKINGREFQLSDPHTPDGMAVLRFCQDGTWVEIFSDHPRETLLDIAQSFNAVST